jgi:glycerol kinase
VGYWKDQADVAANWQADRRFEPAMAADERLERLAKWGDAVARTKAWAQ